MKITDYQSTKELTSDSIFLVDGSGGTKKILATDAILSVLGLVSVENHRRIFRGKNLGTTLTTEQKTAIQNGTFTDLWLGDYWVINAVNWRIVDFDYWYGIGSPAFNTHHVVVMPDTSLTSAAMNGTSVTTGGYISSKMYTETLPTVTATITSAFSGAVLTHKEYLINAVTSGYPSAGAWYDSIVELPNEPMIYGSYIYAPSGNGTIDVKRYTNSNRQLALFAMTSSFLVGDTGFWLRDVASATHFARVDNYGGATSTGAANSYGVRPVFAIG